MTLIDQCGNAKTMDVQITLHGPREVGDYAETLKRLSFGAAGMMCVRISRWCQYPDDYQEDQIFIARHQGTIVGWSYPRDTEYGCFVDPNWRRQGIGSQLYRVAAQHFSQEVELCRHDTASRGFYERMTSTERLTAGWAMEKAS